MEHELSHSCADVLEVIEHGTNYDITHHFSKLSLPIKGFGYMFLDLKKETSFILKDHTNLRRSISSFRVNSLAPGRCGCNLKCVILKLTLIIDIISISCKNVIK